MLEERRALLRSLLRALTGNDLGSRAAGLAFYSFLALVPALTLLTSIYGLIADPNHIGAQLDRMMSPLLPPSAYELVERQLVAVVGSPPATLGAGLVLSSLLALWASSRATRAMIVSCNAFYHEAERRPIWRLLLLSLGLTVSGLVYGAVCVALLVVVPALPRLLRTPAWIDILAGALRWPLLAALMMIWLAAVYTLAPSPRVRGLQWALWGAALASSLWLLVSFLYSTVLTHFARVSATYGALAGTAATMIWLYLSAITILLGAQLNAKIEVHARRA